MTIWKLTTRYEKNIIERHTWTKNGTKAVRDQCWFRGTWISQADQKPNVDLANENGYNISNTEYNWQLDTINDHAWNKWAFTKNTSESDQLNIKTLWESNGDAGMASDGWTKGNVEYFIYGHLKLVNQDTGEEWVGDFNK